MPRYTQAELQNALVESLTKKEDEETFDIVEDTEGNQYYLVPTTANLDELLMAGSRLKKQMKAQNKASSKMAKQQKRHDVASKKIDAIKGMARSKGDLKRGTITKPEYKMQKKVHKAAYRTAGKKV